MTDLYRKYHYGVRSFVKRKIEDEDVVDEITNDVFMAGISGWENFDHKCSEFSYLCAIAKHKIIDYYRKKKLKTILFSANPLFEEIADQALSPERDVLKSELTHEIEKTLTDLKEGYGKLLRLKYIDGWKIQKIAEFTKLSIKAVESRLVRARRSFQQSWEYDSKKTKEIIMADSTDRS